jgi:Rhamnogalacturonan I lyases beta-sheet domain
MLLGLVSLASVSASAQSQSTYLSWVASASAASNPSLTYNIYRASLCSGTFVKINAAPVTATSYLDDQPAPGSYCYEVTAVLSGSESAPSNTAAATILPIQPQSPATNSSATPASAKTTCSHAGDLIGWIRCVAAKARAEVAPPLPVR